ncbi:MAG: tetratricopeptide repeat protein [Desulfobacteraceae bacterium]|jgi:tetratricopeptide (TPR) repeat protein
MGLFSFLIKSPEKKEAEGDAYFNARKFGPAKLEYESALELIEKKHPDDAAMKDRVLEKLKNSRESLARQHLETGDKLIESNALDEAERMFSLALSLTENPELQLTLKGRIALTIKDMPEDEDEVDQMDEPTEEPEDYDAEHEFEVLCMTLSEEMGQAYKSYGETFKEGFLALSHGDFDRAAVQLHKAMEEHPSDDSHIPVELATALIHLGQADEAIDHLTFYLQNNPSSFHGISMLCDIFCELKRFDLAHGVIEQAPETMRKSATGARFNGRIYYLEGDYKKAEEIFRDVLTDKGWNTDVARDLAMTLGASDQNEEAKALYADLLNQCAGCGQRLNPLDKKAFADLSLKMNDYSDKILKLYLELANDHEEIRSDCFSKASMIFSRNGNEKEAARFKKLAEATA